MSCFPLCAGCLTQIAIRFEQRLPTRFQKNKQQIRIKVSSALEVPYSRLACTTCQKSSLESHTATWTSGIFFDPFELRNAMFCSPEGCSVFIYFFFFCFGDILSVFFFFWFFLLVCLFGGGCFQSKDHTFISITFATPPFTLAVLKKKNTKTKTFPHMR